MNELAIQKIQLPNTIEDLSKFVLVGREKIASIRAEIRAINKLELAEEVRNQKRDEALMLSEALLDAEVRLGELLKQVPKQIGGDRKSEKYQADTAVHLIKAKKEVIQDLGFSEKQAQRFEILADNKDLVEQVKAEARENDGIPTRSRVIDLAKARIQKIVANPKGTNPDEYIDFAHKVAKEFLNVIYAPLTSEITDEKLQAWLTTFDKNFTTQQMVSNITRSIKKLDALRTFLMNNRR